MPPARGYDELGAQASASSALRTRDSCAGVTAGAVPVGGFSRFVIPHSRLPSRLPAPGTASMRTLIWLVRTTRPSRFRLIGPSTRLRIWHAPWMGGSCEAVAVPEGPAPTTEAGITTFFWRTLLVLPFLRIVPLSAPSVTILFPTFWNLVIV